MKNILNLILYLIIIVILILFSNRLSITNRKKNLEIKEEFMSGDKKILKEEKISIPEGNPTISFNYDSVPNSVEENILDRYNKESKNGANIYPQYDHSDFTQQKAIHDWRMYESTITRDRTLEMDTNKDELPKTIKQIFDDSITDFKKLVPKKDAKTGDFTSQGSFNLSLFSPDSFSYDNERPENGGMNKETKLYSYDPLLELDRAIF